MPVLLIDIGNGIAIIIEPFLSQLKPTARASPISSVLPELGQRIVGCFLKSAVEIVYGRRLIQLHFSEKNSGESFVCF